MAVEGVSAVLGVELAAVLMIDGAGSHLHCKHTHSTDGRIKADAFAPVPIGQ